MKAVLVELLNRPKLFVLTIVATTIISVAAFSLPEITWDSSEKNLTIRGAYWRDTQVENPVNSKP